MKSLTANVLASVNHVHSHLPTHSHHTRSFLQSLSFSCCLWSGALICVLTAPRASFVNVLNTMQHVQLIRSASLLQVLLCVRHCAGCWSYLSVCLSPHRTAISLRNSVLNVSPAPHAVPGTLEDSRYGYTL